MKTSATRYFSKDIESEKTGVVNNAWLGMNEIKICPNTGKAYIKLEGWVNGQSIADEKEPNDVMLYNEENVWEIPEFMDLFNAMLVRMVTKDGSPLQGATLENIPTPTPVE